MNLPDTGGPRLLEVGRIGKAHGLRGEVLVRLISDRPERLDPGAELIAQSDGRALIVMAARPHQEKWIVQFEGVEGRTSAEQLHGTVLLGEPIDDPDALFVHDLVGCRVVDAAGRDRGRVTAVQANPASDLLVLESGALVPLTFVVGGIEAAAEDRMVRVDTPDGLFELYEPDAD